MRAAFVKRPLESYADAHALNVWTGTWNTNGKPPPASLDISAWLDVASSPDLVVVGFQEIVPLTPGKVLMQEDAQATGEWEAIIERCLNGAAGDAPAPPEPAGAAATPEVMPTPAIALDAALVMVFLRLFIFPAAARP